MKYKTLLALAFAAHLAAVTAAYALTPVRILWEYKGIPAEMKIFEPAINKPLNLWDMGTAKAVADLPVGAEIQGSTLTLAPGMKKTFILVYHNTSDKKARFFAAPHHAMPSESALGFKFHCLCVNHIYEVNPGEYWYRAVEFHLAKEYVGEKLDVVHELVVVDDARKNPGGI